MGSFALHNSMLLIDINISALYRYFGVFFSWFQTVVSFEAVLVGTYERTAGKELEEKRDHQE